MKEIRVPMKRQEQVVTSTASEIISSKVSRGYAHVSDLDDTGVEDYRKLLSLETQKRLRALEK